jgi:hypothetical protein
VSNIPSYNRIADGSDKETVRGQFIAGSASSLVKELAKGRLSLQYVFEFGRLLVDYTFSTKAVQSSITNFGICMVGSDFHWIEHDDPKNP